MVLRDRYWPHFIDGQAEVTQLISGSLTTESTLNHMATDPSSPSWWAVKSLAAPSTLSGSRKWAGILGVSGSLC